MIGAGLVRGGARRLIRATARDVTEHVAGNSALVIAPHPDDETLGCGATILRKVRAGSPVTVLVVTDGRGSHASRAMTPDELAEIRREEMTEAARRLGVTDLRWGGMPDGGLAEQENKLVALIAGLVEELQPAEIYATCAEEPHPDHAAVGRAARQAIQDRIPVYEYPVWLWGAWPLSRSAPVRSLAAAAGLAATRGARAVRTGEVLPDKLHALAAHASQLRRPSAVPADEDWPTLPPAVLAAARDRAELFLPTAVTMPAIV